MHIDYNTGWHIVSTNNWQFNTDNNGNSSSSEIEMINNQLYILREETTNNQGEIPPSSLFYDIAYLISKLNIYT